MATKREVKLVYYIGEDFYYRSGTMMSSYYTENGMRYDLGSLSSDLQNGIAVRIEPAPDNVMRWAYKKLDECCGGR